MTLDEFFILPRNEQLAILINYADTNYNRGYYDCKTDYDAGYFDKPKKHLISIQEFIKPVKFDKEG